jgi:glycosyltransferase involved in cell wall biosynthesis
MEKSVLFFVPYPEGKAPSQRFRFEQYFKILEKNKIEYKVKSFYSKKTWEILHFEGRLFSKIVRIIWSFFIRFFQLFQVFKYDLIFIHREITPIGPPVLEWIIAKILRKKIIYDFDDAIWLPNYSEANTNFQKLKYYSKVNQIMKWATKVSAGNRYLSEYVMKFNENVIVNPTTIDTEFYHNPDLYKSNRNSGKIVIGWTGTHTTAKYLEFLIPIFEKLSFDFDFEFCIISNEEPASKFTNSNFIKWSKETEIEDLLRFDIGVMPLSDDKWAKGKCGFKALQYMSLGIPAIASPVGINTEIIDHGKNGFLCSTEKQWYESIRYLLENSDEIKKMHDSAREKIINKYSVVSNEVNFLKLFEI